jgi:uncharacterized membrane protein
MKNKIIIGSAIILLGLMFFVLGFSIDTSISDNIIYANSMFYIGKIIFIFGCLYLLGNSFINFYFTKKNE